MCCFKQKTAYEMRISDWSSDVCSSDLHGIGGSATIAPLDLTDGDSIARLASAMAERWQHLDMLVLNAAMLGTLTRSEERRVGNESVRTWRSRWSPVH